MNSTQKPLRVMVVDDSAVIRGLLKRIIRKEPDMCVSATVSNGQSALTALRTNPTDVVLLDVEMPVLDGLSTIPHLRRDFPHIHIIMVSTLTRKGAQETMRALSSGASDYVPKPTLMQGGKGLQQIEAELLYKIRALKPRAPETPVDQPRALQPPPDPTWTPCVLAVGASTGGPNALVELLSALPSALTLPILIVQHMPPIFTTLLAERLGKVTGRTALEAADGRSIEPGRIYVAPGDHHMMVGERGGDRILRLNQAPRENFCRPAVDPLFRSAAETYGWEVLAVVLTGMGQDGQKGSEAIIHHGGVVLAQDEASSVVWGMPGAIAEAGLATAILPLSDLPSHIMRFCEVSVR